MAINFPSTSGQATDGSFTHTNLATGATWAWNGTSWESLGVDATTAVTVVSGISLVDLSVGTPALPSGTGALNYDNTSGVFTFIPPDFTTVTFSNIASKPNTIAGYGITDAFDGAYASLTGAPTIPADVSDLTDTTNLIPVALTDLGIVDGAPGQVLTTNGAAGFTFEDATSAGEAYDQSLNTTDQVTFDRITINELVRNGTGPVVFSSATYTQIDSQDGTRVSGGPFRLPNISTTERNTLIAANGDMIYNTTANKLQAYQNGAWINIEDGSTV